MRTFEEILNDLLKICPKIIIEQRSLRFFLEGRWFTVYSHKGETFLELIDEALNLVEGKTPWPEKWSG